MKKKLTADNKRAGHYLRSRPTIAFCILLPLVAIIVLAAHWPSISAKAFLFDDDQYLLENHLVQEPSFRSAEKFLTEVLHPSTVRGYYQPFAMISLMLDVAMGASPEDITIIHITSLCLHIVNTLLISVLIYLLFRNPLASIVIGLFFGLHPVTIEPVVWLSERKTLLATFFVLLSLIFYIIYVRKKSIPVLLFSILTFIFSLLSKPTTIALPFLLLLLDYWPLKRFSKKAVLEKIPFVLIAIFSAAITYISQSSTSLAKTPGQTGWLAIIYTITHNIIFYLHNLLWPINLSWYYPYPKPFDLSDLGVLAGVLGTAALIPALIISTRWTKSCLIGWLFFFLAIFPTLGIIGFHPVIAADRHLYFPVLGLLIPIACLLTYLFNKQSVKSFSAYRIILIAIFAIICCMEFMLTRCYSNLWQTKEGVYRYMLARTPEVPILHNNLANILSSSDRTHEAIEHFEKSLELKLNSPEVHNNLANAFAKIGKYEQAVEHYQQAIKLKPDFAPAHYNLALAQFNQGKIDQAIENYKKAIDLKPDYSQAMSGLGYALMQKADIKEAVKWYEQSLQIDNKDIITHGRLGLAYASNGQIEKAIEQFRIVLSARPMDYEMHYNIAVMLEKTGKTKQALEHYKKAIDINPDFSKARDKIQALSM